VVEAHRVSLRSARPNTVKPKAHATASAELDLKHHVPVGRLGQFKPIRGFSAPGGLETKLRMLRIEGSPAGGMPSLFDL
jgi:hypothetical protein